MEDKREKPIEPVIPNIYKSSKIAASLNAIIAFAFFYFSNIAFEYSYISSFIMFLVGFILLQFSCNEFRISAALDRSIKMVNK